MTSPVRAFVAAGVTSSAATQFGTTVTGSSARAAPALAVTVALPGRSATIRPSAPTRTTSGAELRQVMRSSRSSRCAESERPVRSTRCPRTSRSTGRSSSMSAAGPGTIATSTRSMTGSVPGTMAITVTGSVPVAPDDTSPNSSTVPSKCTPAGTNRMRAPAIGVPAESSAWARSRSVSCTTTFGCAGSTTTAAIGEGGSCWSVGGPAGAPPR